MKVDTRSLDYYIARVSKLQLAYSSWSQLRQLGLAVVRDLC